MKRTGFCSARLIALGIAALLASTMASAQLQGPNTGVAYAQPSLPQVTISANRQVKSQVVGQASNGAAVELVTLMHRVSYADLDLARPAAQDAVSA
jgi:hypothetical protein